MCYRIHKAFEYSGLMIYSFLIRYKLLLGDYMKNVWNQYPFIREQLEKFEEYLLHVLQSRQPLINNAITELVLSGGKRLRPALVFAAGQFSNTPLKKLMPIAAAVESKGNDYYTI